MANGINKPDSCCNLNRKLMAKKITLSQDDQAIPKNQEYYAEINQVSLNAVKAGDIVIQNILNTDAI